ncbi:hypothetical protein HY024_03435 [Candidatus Curtissbacteria bacterium]|nr:hypothetical protein [Candidatus Curtissbacteria bacterium]
MSLTTTTVASLVAILVCVLATYNAYRLRGGKMALGQILMALGMIALLFSLLVDRLGADFQLVETLKASDLFYVAGFLLMLLSSLRMMAALK